MFKKTIEDLATSKTKEEAIINSEKVRDEFDKLIQPIDAISTNREMMESSIELFIRDFDNPDLKNVAKEGILMLRGFTQF